MNGEHFRDFFDSPYLGSWDLPRNKGVVVTIVKVERGDLVGMKGRKDKKAIIHFQGKEKAMAANITNCKSIAAMHGNNPRTWVGKQIELYVAENVDSPNGPVDAIRVRPRIPQSQPANGRGRAQQPPPPPVEPEWHPDEPPPGALETDHEPS